MLGAGGIGRWRSVLSLDSSRKITAGSYKDLVDAVRRGADLRIALEFVHNEHIDVRSPCAEVVREACEYGVTYLLDDRWAAGIMSLRQPVALPDDLGPRSSMSFFLSNQDGAQGIARPYLDGSSEAAFPGATPLGSAEDPPKYHPRDVWDAQTNAPSSNFVYDFDLLDYYVSDSWEQVLSHDAEGGVVSGSVDSLASAFADGCAVKVGISGLCSDFALDAPSMDHEVFVETGSCYYYVDSRIFIAGAHPVVRVSPEIPLRYQSQGWDFGWLLLRTDGAVVDRRCDPYTLAFSDHRRRLPIRWFVR
ncbi:MAG: hypothetical protein CMJ18_22690 [Phycisphaeraceae bacterium]|nr:hypothetical protein [Phycisphaeraceae bacterium]